MEQAVLRTHEAAGLAAEAAGLAAAKAGELDEHYQLSERAERFLSREVEVDEAILGATAQGLWDRAVERLAPVGALAERVIDEAMKPISEEQLELVENTARELGTSGPPAAGRPREVQQRPSWSPWWRR